MNKVLVIKKAHDPEHTDFNYENEMLGWKNILCFAPIPLLRLVLI